MLLQIGSNPKIIELYRLCTFHNCKAFYIGLSCNIIHYNCEYGKLVTENMKSTRSNKTRGDLAMQTRGPWATSFT